MSCSIKLKKKKIISEKIERENTNFLYFFCMIQLINRNAVFSFKRDGDFFLLLCFGWNWPTFGVVFNNFITEMLIHYPECYKEDMKWESKTWIIKMWGKELTLKFQRQNGIFGNTNEIRFCFSLLLPFNLGQFYMRVLVCPQVVF